MLDGAETVPAWRPRPSTSDGLLYVLGPTCAFYVHVEAPEGSPVKRWAGAVARRVARPLRLRPGRLSPVRPAPVVGSTGMSTPEPVAAAAPDPLSPRHAAGPVGAAGHRRRVGHGVPRHARWSTSPCPTSGRTSTPRVAGLQWVINGYLLVLSALILLGGSLGDRYGRRRIFQLGVVVFADRLDRLRDRARHRRAAGRRAGGPGRGRGAADARQPRHPRGQLPPGGPVPGHRRLVGPHRRGLGHRAVRGRVAGRRRVVAGDLPHQHPAGRGGGGRLGPARARDA